MSGPTDPPQPDKDLLRRLLEDPTVQPTDPPVVAPRLPATLANAPATSYDEDWDENLAKRPKQPVPTDGQSRASRLRHAARLGLFALAVIGAVAGIAVAWMHVVTDPLADARAYYDAATRLNLGEALYPASADPNAAGFYRYPPLLAIVLRPAVAFVSYPVFAVGWEVLVVGSFALLVRQLGIRSERTWLAIGILGVPIGWALAIAQAQVPLTLLLAIGQPWSIALATNLKLFPALALLWWLGRRDGEAMVAFVLWMGLLAVAQWVLAPDASMAFIGSVKLSDVGDVRNISPYAIDPGLWLFLLGVGIAVAFLAARSGWGWPAAVALATLASPRLLVYMLMGLLAAIREPKVPGQEPQGIQFQPFEFTRRR